MHKSGPLTKLRCHCHQIITWLLVQCIDCPQTLVLQLPIQTESTQTCPELDRNTRGRQQRCCSDLSAGKDKPGTYDHGKADRPCLPKGGPYKNALIPSMLDKGRGTRQERNDCDGENVEQKQSDRKGRY